MDLVVKRQAQRAGKLVDEMAEQTKAKETKVEPFDPKGVRRERALAWDPKANAGKGGAVVTSDLTDADGRPVDAECSKWNVDPRKVTYLTVADLGEPYTLGSARIQDIVKHAAANAGYSPNDYVLSLILKDAMQDAYNESVRVVRPVTDRAKERASNTLRSVLKAQGRSEAEIAQVLAALG